MNKYIRNRQVLLLLGDVFVVVVSTYLSYNIRLLQPINVIYTNPAVIVFFSVSYVLSFYAFDMYSLEEYRFKTNSYLARFIAAVTAGTVLNALAFYLLPFWRAGRGIFTINVIFVSIFTYLWRLVFVIIFNLSNKKKSIAIVGAGAAGSFIYDILSSRDDYFEIKGFFDDDPAKLNMKVGTHYVVGNNSLLPERVANDRIDAVVIAITREKKPELFKTLVKTKTSGVQIYDMPLLYEELTGKIPVMYVSNEWLAVTNFEGMRRNIYTNKIKGLIDKFLSFAFLILLLPIMAIASMAIKLTSAGPVIYRQQRVGLNGDVFELMKFRSMYQNSESNGAVWAQQNDPRVTPIGRIMRKTRIDEIPQMLNVLKGEMSFIGPRPERPEFVEQLNEEIPFYSLRHTVKPGISGWAQINYRYGASKTDALEKLQYDLFYIKNLSSLLDLQIILRTTRVVLFGKGAR